MAVETFVLVSSNSDTEFVRHAVRREKRHCPSEATLADIRRPSRLQTVAEKGSSKSVRGRQKQYPRRSRGKERQQQEIYCFPLELFSHILCIFDKVTKKTTMKAIRYVLFATALLLFASCGRQPSDIIESSPNGVTGVKMPILVTFKENVEPKEDRIREAVSISPSVDFDVYLSGMRMLRIIPRSPPEIRHPLQGDHRCRETHRTAAQRRRGIRIRHAETAVRLQRLLAAAKATT